MRKYFLIFLLFFLLISFISSAAVQINQNVQTGLTIDYPKFDFIQRGQAFNLTIHTTNNSDGKVITSPNCTLQIQNSTGGLVIDDVSFTKISNHHNYYLSSGNFSTNGFYDLFIDCEDVGIGGFASVSFKVTTKGVEGTTPQILLYIFMECLLILFLMMCLYGAFTIPYQNEKNNNQETISINWKKYLKIFCFGMSYFLLIAIVFIMWNLIYGYSDWSTASNIFHYLFRILWIPAIPGFIIWWIFIIIKYLDDKKIDKFIKKMGIGYHG